MKQFFECGVCGGNVPAKSLTCPECGADAQTGLHGDQDDFTTPDLPGEDNFDYDRYIEREFGQPRPKSRKESIIAAVAIVLIIVWALLYVL